MSESSPKTFVKSIDYLIKVISIKMYRKTLQQNFPLNLRKAFSDFDELPSSCIRGPIRLWTNLELTNQTANFILTQQLTYFILMIDLRKR